MKKCECGACKWKTVYNEGAHVLKFQCLKCYRFYTKGQLKKLKDK